MIEKTKKNKLLFTILGIVCLIALIASGTYAVLLFNASVTNGTYDGQSSCFLIDYSATDISGTLWPRLNASTGLHNSISMKVNSNCHVCGDGTIKINVDSSTDDKYFEIVPAHCENPDTLETMDEYTTSSNCSSSGGIWVTNGTALKYAVYDNDTASGNPLSKGYISGEGEMNVYTNIPLSHIENNLYLFIWLDGYQADNEYSDLSFSGTLSANAIQNDDPSCGPPDFATDSWSKILTTVRSDPTLYPVGSTKEIALSGFTNSESGSDGLYTIRVVNNTTPSECNTLGFSQTACGFVIEFVDIITNHVMNSTQTSAGGYPGSEMYEYIATSIYNALPSDIKSSMIETFVVSGHGSTSSSNFTSTDYLYLLSAKEVYNLKFGTEYSFTRQLDYYNSIGVTNSNVSGAKKNKSWWLRTESSTNNGMFGSVGSQGSFSTTSAKTSGGVAPAFRIG